MIARWKGPVGPMFVIGEVFKVTGQRVWVTYYYEHNNGGQVFFGLKTTTRKREEVEPYVMKEGDLTPHQRVDRRMAITRERLAALKEEQDAAK